MATSPKKKRKVKIACRELTDVDVSHISIVHRPASRRPFGIMKNDQKGNTMFQKLDLASLFQKNEGEATVLPVVTSVLVNGDVSESLLEILKNEGFATDDSKVVNGVTIFSQEADSTGDDQIVKITDNVALAVSVVKADGAFAERCAARGFYPSISIATELLQDELYRAIEKSDSPGSASEKITSLVSDFGTYMAGLIGGLPGMVFKAEESISKMDSGSSDDSEDMDDDDKAKKAKKSKAKKDDTAEAEAEAEDEAEDEVESAEDTGADDADSEETEVSKDDDDEKPEDTAQKGVDMADVIAQVTKGVADAISPQIEALNERIGAVEGVAKAAKETVNQSVFGGVFGVDSKEERNEPVEKNEDAELGFIDTGFTHFAKRDKTGARR